MKSTEIDLSFTINFASRRISFSKPSIIIKLWYTPFGIFLISFSTACKDLLYIKSDKSLRFEISNSSIISTNLLQPISLHAAKEYTSPSVSTGCLVFWLINFKSV